VSNERILVVDDDEAVLKSLKGILESEGYGVDTTQEGRQALARFESQSYDLVLLDIKLPDMEGTKLLEALHDRFPEAVKIMVTGYPTLTNAVKSLNSGADAYLMKPVNPRRLLRTVKSRLDQREKARNSGRERMEEPEKGERGSDRLRSNEKPPVVTRSENRPVDEMIERAISLLQDEGSRKRSSNRPRAKKVETKNKAAQVQKPQSSVPKPQKVVQNPQSPEQSFWFSLADLDFGNTGTSKSPKKPKKRGKA